MEVTWCMKWVYVQKDEKMLCQETQKNMNIFVCIGGAVIFCLFATEKWFTTVLKSRKRSATFNVLQREYTGTEAIRCHCKSVFPLIKCIQGKPGKELSAFPRRFFFFFPNHFVPVASLLNSQCPADFSSNSTYILNLLKLAYPKSLSKPSIVEFYRQEESLRDRRFFFSKTNSYIYILVGQEKERKQNPQVQGGCNSKWLAFYLNSIFISFLGCSERNMEVLSSHEDY